MMRKIWLLVGLLVLLAGCTQLIPRRVEKKFICYDGQSQSITSLIDIDGYFARPINGYDEYGYSHNIVFFENGMFNASFFDDPRKRSDNRCDYQQRAREIMQAVAINPDTVLQGKWGTYTVSGDTIKTQYIGTVAYGNKEVMQQWFKVMDRRTVKTIFYMELNERQSKQDIINYNRVQVEQSEISPYRFVPFENGIALPSENAWIRKEKWFWCK